MDNRERRVEFFRKFKNMEGGRNSDFVLQTNSHYSYISRKIFQGKEKIIHRIVVLMIPLRRHLPVSHKEKDGI